MLARPVPHSLSCARHAGSIDPWDPVGRHRVPLPHQRSIATLLGDMTAESDSGRL